MPDNNALLDQIRVARAKRDLARRDSHASQVERLALQRKSERDERAGLRGRQATTPAALRRSAESVAALARTDDDLSQALAGLIVQLHQDDSPQALTAELDANIPILLLPLRVETRWRDSELLVRVFPDEIAITTHEETLTTAENAAGEAYWRSLAAIVPGADSGQTGRKEAWRKLVDVFDAPRADYVVRSCKPTNWPAGPTDPPVAPDALVFAPQPALKEEQWTQAPRVTVLPDRLQLLLLRGGQIVHSAPGALIDDIVHAGPAPLQSDGEASWSRDDEGRIAFDAQSLWLKDFAAAVSAGLGFRVPLREEDEAGFDELIVLGLKYSAGADDGSNLVARLFEGHRFSEKGLAFVPQGTATNNTSAEDAGLDSIDWFADASFQAQQSGGTAATTDLDAASDGSRLAHFLGLDPTLFDGVPHADAMDHAEAVAMNTALYPGTLGYFLRTMIPETASVTALGEFRRFFIRYVTGRGPLAAIRVGEQPYGILLAAPAPRDLPLPGGHHPVEPVAHSVERIIARARHYWERFAGRLPHLGASNNASADLLAVLGLQPTAAAYFQRISASYDLAANIAAIQTGGDRMDEVFQSLFQGKSLQAMNVLRALGYDSQRADGSAKPYPLLFQLIHQRYQSTIPLASLIDGQPFSEGDPIKPYDAAGSLNYIDWLAANARDPAALRTQDFSGAPRPTFLLYMLLRHALLIQTAASVHLWLGLYEIEAPELLVGRKFASMTSALDVTAWEMLAAPASSLSGVMISDRPLAALVHLPEYRFGANAAIGAPLGEMLDAYQILRGLPTARLERLLAEHVDTLSYRIDAWETALMENRLRALRETPGRGLYLGSVGYLEGLRRAKGRRRKVEEASLPESLRDGSGEVYAPIDAAGYFHVPSLNHAAAGAILRNGYLTHATPDDPGRLAVNLDSRRVRRAKELMDGIGNGQPLEILLGIEFERGLQDATTRSTAPVILADLKPAFRAAFPNRRTRVPKAGHAADQPEIVPDYTVANGLAIIAASAAFPTGVPGLPALDGARIAELRAIRDRMRDSLDALKDVVTAESAYQLALGNFERSAAMVQAISGAFSPHDIEVTRSSRGTDLSFTQRLTLQFDPAAASKWPGALTPRARMEPPLNAWIADLLGDPKLIACKVVLTDENGVATITSVQASDLGLQPIDLLYLARGVRDAAGPAELETRIAAAAIAGALLPAYASAAIAFAETGPASAGAAAFAGPLALLDLLHQVVASARAIDGRDSITASKPLAMGTEATGIDIGELRGRVAALLASFATLATDLDTAAASAGAAGAGAPALAALDAVLRRAADAGVPFATPSGIGSSRLAQAASVAAAIAAMRASASASETASNVAALSLQQQADLLIKTVQAFFGSDFRVLPRFLYPNAPDIAACEADRDAIIAAARAGDAAADPVSEVFTSVSHVRASVHRANRLRLMHDVAAPAPLPIAALQLPHRIGDTWLGAALPEGIEIFDDTLSVIQLRPQGFAPAGMQCGLLIDEWVESFPRKKEVTGIAFGFDQPNSVPLQALMLAVAPDDAAHWNWDGLIGIIRQTIARAKLRAVEPDMLDGLAGVTTLVPATMAEFSTSKGALSLDFGLAIPLILTKAIEIGYAAPPTAKG